MKKTERWIFLRGLAREQRHWNGFPEVFRESSMRPSSREAHLETECLDLAGCGTELSRPSFLSLDQNLEDLRLRSGFLKGSNQKISLMTVSLGGMLGLLWAIKYPNEVEHLVVMNSSSSNFSRFYQRLLPKNYVPLLSLGLCSPRQREIESLRMTTQLIERPRLVEIAEKFANYTSIQNHNFARQLFAASRFKLPSLSDETRQNLAEKVLILVGEKDNFVSPSCSEGLAHYLNSQVRRHPLAGHDLSLDDPDWVCDQVDSWIGRNQRRV